MPNFYKLSFTKQVFPFDEGVQLYQGDSPLQFYAPHKGELGRYEYNNNTWKETLSIDLLRIKG